MGGHQGDMMKTPKTRITVYIWTDSTQCVHTATASRFRELQAYYKAKGETMETTGLQRVRKTLAGVWK